MARRFMQVNSSLLVPAVFFCILYSDTLDFCDTIKVSDQVLHQIKQ